MMAGKIKGVSKVATRKDFFLTLAKYSRWITSKTLCMATCIYLLDKNFFHTWKSLLEGNHLPKIHQFPKQLIGRLALKRNQ